MGSPQEKCPCPPSDFTSSVGNTAPTFSRKQGARLVVKLQDKRAWKQELTPQIPSLLLKCVYHQYISLTLLFLLLLVDKILQKQVISGQYSGLTPSNKKDKRLTTALLNLLSKKFTFLLGCHNTERLLFPVTAQRQTVSVCWVAGSLPAFQCLCSSKLSLVGIIHLTKKKKSFLHWVS